MSTQLNIESEEFEKLAQSMEQYGQGASDVVSKVIHESGDSIKQHIDPLIHASGRRFKGHTSSAKGSAWQRYDTGEPLAITVRTVSRRNYLYFPDDGSNTKHHFGNQRFMLRGAEAAAPAILDKGIQALITAFERS